MQVNNTPAYKLLHKNYPQHEQFIQSYLNQQVKFFDPRYDEVYLPTDQIIGFIANQIRLENQILMTTSTLTPVQALKCYLSASSGCQKSLQDQINKHNQKTTETLKSIDQSLQIIQKQENEMNKFTKIGGTCAEQMQILRNYIDQALHGSYSQVNDCTAFCSQQAQLINQNISQYLGNNGITNPVQNIDYSLEHALQHKGLIQKNIQDSIESRNQKDLLVIKNKLLNIKDTTLKPYEQVKQEIVNATSKGVQKLQSLITEYQRLGEIVLDYESQYKQALDYMNELK
ncbi:Conserved_hypothetical protein [Hexamita inflata]|uniref:Uncharacterized protein n=1 Tax=Hexamita inflata TaxID=28002 RepID=A0AA86QWD9_9EUKA|nr:Conserved hypothetical protein [Hexamita inflata]